HPVSLNPLYFIQGIPFGLTIGLITEFASGLSANVLEKSSSVRPNQGIWNSARNSWLIGLLIGLSCGLIGGLFSLPEIGLDSHLDLGLALVVISEAFYITPLIGLIFWSIYGGV